MMISESRDAVMVVSMEGVATDDRLPNDERSTLEANTAAITSL